MGEYHTRYIRGLFKTEQEYQDYIHRKIFISWKKTTQELFSDIYTMENEIDEQGISVDDKNKFLDLFVGYARERRKEICDLDSKARQQASEAAKKIKKIERQRNIAMVACVILLVSALFLSLRPTPAAENESLPFAADTQQEVVVTEQNYVASINSDKYHRLSCDYAENILEENRVYYATAEEAEEAGKEPCSVCRPVNTSAVQDNFAREYLEARERMMNLP